MSTGPRRPHAEARAQAERLIALLGGTFEGWTIAGSVRRQRPEVGDCEHVVVPKFVPRVTQTMFGPVQEGETNLLWERIDQLVVAGAVSKAVYGHQSPDDPDEWTGPDTAAIRHRWGEKYRGVLFEGFKHEIFTATPANFGAILAIRTGPAEFSKHMVSVLKDGGIYRMQDGCVRYSRDGAIRSCGTEEEFFRMCNVPYMPPSMRDSYQPKRSAI